MKKYIEYYKKNTDFIFMFGIPLVLLFCGIISLIVDHFFNKFKLLLKKQDFDEFVKLSYEFRYNKILVPSQFYKTIDYLLNVNRLYKILKVFNTIIWQLRHSLLTIIIIVACKMSMCMIGFNEVTATMHSILYGFIAKTYMQKKKKLKNIKKSYSDSCIYTQKKGDLIKDLERSYNLKTIKSLDAFDKKYDTVENVRNLNVSHIISKPIKFDDDYGEYVII